MQKFMSYHTEFTCTPNFYCELQNKWAMLGGEGNLLMLVALDKMLSVLQMHNARPWLML